MIPTYKPADILVRLQFSPLVDLDKCPLGFFQPDDGILCVKTESGYVLLRGESMPKLYATTRVYPAQMVEVGFKCDGEVT